MTREGRKGLYLFFSILLLFIIFLFCYHLTGAYQNDLEHSVLTANKSQGFINDTLLNRVVIILGAMFLIINIFALFSVNRAWVRKHGPTGILEGSFGGVMYISILFIATLFLKEFLGIHW